MPARLGERPVVRGRVLEIHGPRLFTVREPGREGREQLVLSPYRIDPDATGASIVVEGALRRLDATELAEKGAVSDESTGARFAGQLVLIASSVVMTMPFRPRPAPRRVPSLPAAARHKPLDAPPDQLPLTITATTLAADIDWLAGQRVRILKARVVGVLEPEAFLIEPATRYRDALGYRDRVLVLIRNGTLKVSAELVVGATIRLEGEARTLLGARVTAEVPWPERLTRRAVKRLDVRAAVLATSVQTPEGVDLAERAAASPIGDSGGE